MGFTSGILKRIIIYLNRKLWKILYSWLAWDKSQWSKICEYNGDMWFNQILLIIMKLSDFVQGRKLNRCVHHSVNCLWLKNNYLFQNNKINTKFLLHCASLSVLLSYIHAHVYTIIYIICRLGTLGGWMMASVSTPNALDCTFGSRFLCPTSILRHTTCESQTIWRPHLDPRSFCSDWLSFWPNQCDWKGSTTVCPQFCRSLDKIWHLCHSLPLHPDHM